MTAPVVVVGAGISGLAAAWTLQNAGREVVVLESAVAAGGKLRSAHVAGVEVDVGAEAMLARRPEGLELLAELGLTSIAPITTSASVRAGGSLHPLPARTMLGIPTDLDALTDSGVLTPHAVERVAAEPGLDPLPPSRADRTVGDLVRERLGNEVTDRLVEPLLGGVYAGRADELSLQATMPALAAELRRGGSLVGAARSVLGRTPPSTAPVFASVPGGLGAVPTALAARLDVRTGVTVRTIRRDGNGFSLDCGARPSSFVQQASAVVVAVPAAKAARLLADVAPAATDELVAIRSASMAIVTLAYDGIDLPPGSGLLVGSREGFSVKGVTFTSKKWPLPAGSPVMLRASVGRTGDEHVLQRADDDLMRMVRYELTRMIGINAEPVDARVTRWGGGLPQYGVGHVRRVARIRAAVAQVPGLAICGASFDGVGIPACIATARSAAAGLGE